jgi:hypothetical protein
MPALGASQGGMGCQGPVVSAPALVPHRLAKGVVGSLKGRVPLLSSAWLLGCEWWALLAGPTHERMNARSCRVWAGPGVGRCHADIWYRSPVWPMPALGASKGGGMSGAGSQRPGFSPTSASQGGRGQLKRESPLLSSA